MHSIIKAHETNKNGTEPIDLLPRHMRRRASSHNRWKISEKVKNGNDKNGKVMHDELETQSKHRKDRRKDGKNVIHASYGGNKRLETHVWLAKRMHMEERWGWLLPLRSCNVGVPASVKQTLKFTSIHDSSYMTCLEFTGQSSYILYFLSSMMDPLHPILNDNNWLYGRRSEEFILHSVVLFICIYLFYYK